MFPNYTKFFVLGVSEEEWLSNVKSYDLVVLE